MRRKAPLVKAYGQAAAVCTQCPHYVLSVANISIYMRQAIAIPGDIWSSWGNALPRCIPPVLHGLTRRCHGTSRSPARVTRIGAPSLPSVAGKSEDACNIRCVCAQYVHVRQHSQNLMCGYQCIYGRMHVHVHTAVHREGEASNDDAILFYP